MRAIERIDLFLEFIDGNVTPIIQDIWELNFPEDNQDNFVDDIYSHMGEIRTFWKLNPDLRFSQVLVSLNILPNIPGSWFYTEEEEILERLGIPARDYLLWGQYFNKDGTKMDKPIRRPIKDMDTDHIKNILTGEWTRNPEYIKCFTEELERKNESL
jgi:hypothetical protein